MVYGKTFPCIWRIIYVYDTKRGYSFVNISTFYSLTDFNFKLMDVSDFLIG